MKGKATITRKSTPTIKHLFNMTAGITYDLRSDYLAMGFNEEETAEFDSQDTIIAIESSLSKLGFRTERIGHLQQLMDKLASGKKWDIVFNICEGLYGTGREAAVPAILDAYRIPYVFSDPVTLSLTLHKGLTKRVIRDAGLNTPEFMVVNDPGELRPPPFDFPVFAKPLAEGTGKGINAHSIIENYPDLTNTCLVLLETFRQPVLVEKFLPGREFTVGITGTGKNAAVLGVMEVTLKKEAEQSVYSYSNKAEYEHRVEYGIPEQALVASCCDLALRAYQVLECRDAGRVDIRVDAHGKPAFIEINPLAGLHPVHSDLPILCGLHNVSYDELIRQMMDSACKRYGMKLPLLKPAFSLAETKY